LYKFNIIDKIAIILVIIGAINWGLIGLFNLDLVALLFGQTVGILSRIVYILIGAAGVALVMLITKMTQASKFK